MQHSELTAVCDRLDSESKIRFEQHEARMDEISGTAQQNYKHCLDMCGKLDATLTEKIEAQDERLDDLSSTVEENRAAATAATTAAFGKLDVLVNNAGIGETTSFVDMTLDVMRDFGIQAGLYGDQTYRIPGRQEYRARAYAIEPDAASAGYFAAIAAVTEGRVTIEGISPASCQPDLRFIEVLQRMGCSVERKNESI